MGLPSFSSHRENGSHAGESGRGPVLTWGNLAGATALSTLVACGQADTAVTEFLEKRMCGERREDVARLAEAAGMESVDDAGVLELTLDSERLRVLFRNGSLVRIDRARTSKGLMSRLPAEEGFYIVLSCQARVAPGQLSLESGETT